MEVNRFAGCSAITLYGVYAATVEDFKKAFAEGFQAGWGATYWLDAHLPEIVVCNTKADASCVPILKALGFKCATKFGSTHSFEPGDMCLWVFKGDITTLMPENTLFRVAVKGGLEPKTSNDTIAPKDLYQWRRMVLRKKHTIQQLTAKVVKAKGEKWLTPNRSLLLQRIINGH